MRTMYDSVDPAAIPAGAEMVAGYVDGLYGPGHELAGQPGWDADAWDSFPNAIKVRIAVFAFTDDGQVIDCERGDATPEQCVSWARMRRKAGQIPTVYMSASQWDAVRYAFDAAHEPQPLYWVADYDGIDEVPEGAIAKQFANHPAQNIDESVVLDYWPGVDAPPAPPAPPQPPTMPFVRRIPRPVFLMMYDGFMHVFQVNPKGELWHFSQPTTGGFKPGQSWEVDGAPIASGLPPGALITGDVWANAGHVFVAQSDGKILHAWQTYTNVPPAWGTEVLG